MNTIDYIVDSYGIELFAKRLALHRARVVCRGGKLDGKLLEVAWGVSTDHALDRVDDKLERRLT